MHIVSPMKAVVTIRNEAIELFLKVESR